MTLCIGGFSRVVTFPTAPIATGRSDPCREGLAPSQEPCLPTAHAYTCSPRGPGSLAPVVREPRQLADLTPASGCQDHTTSPSALATFVEQ
jgi:hypothetical protein